MRKEFLAAGILGIGGALVLGAFLTSGDAETEQRGQTAPAARSAPVAPLPACSEELLLPGQRPPRGELAAEGETRQPRTLGQRGASLEGLLNDDARSSEALGAGPPANRPPLGRGRSRISTSGDGQTGAVGMPLAQPFKITVTDRRRGPLEGISVSFSVASGGGSLSVTSATTDANGEASTVLTLGPLPVLNTVTANVGGTSRMFSALAQAVPAASVEYTSGTNQSGLVGSTLAQPLVVTVRDANKQPVQGFTVGFAVVAGGGQLSVSTASTDAQGRASTSLTLGAAAGTNTVTASAAGLTGSPVTFNASALPLPADSIALVSGNAQTGIAGSALAQPFVVVVKDAAGGAVVGHDVTFTVAAGGGTLSATAVKTDAQGRAASTLTLGAVPATNTVTANSTGLKGSPVTFNATGMPAPAAAIALTSGDAQTGVAGSPLAQPLVVTVTDAAKQPVAGFMVAFEVVTGGGALSATAVATDAQGRAAATLTLGKTAGPNSVAAKAAGLAGSPVTFSATGTPGPAAKLAIASGNNQTAEIGKALAAPLVIKVSDANDNPVAGVDVAFAVAAGGGTLSATAVKSDAQGLASTALTLGAAPATNTVTATSAGLVGSPATFTATGVAAKAATIALVSGAEQIGVAGSPLAQPFVVLVTDTNKLPVTGFMGGRCPRRPWPPTTWGARPRS
jgi:adhesin/invasin